MRRVLQANLGNWRRFNRTVKGYHIRNGNANIISYLYQITEKKLFGRLRLDAWEIFSNSEVIIYRASGKQRIESGYTL